MDDESKKDNKEAIESASERFAQILVASIDEQTKPKNAEWTKEERDNVAGVFQILMDVDRRINPHLYKNKNISEINRECA